MERRYRWPDDDASAGDDSGWNRLSIAFHSRKPYRPTISQADLLLPSHPTRLRTLGYCLGCGACMTILYVWVPLMMVNVFVPMPSGAWYGGVIGASLIASTVALYAFSRLEDRRNRELVRDEAVTWPS